jgi:hypothetical protein
MRAIAFDKAGNASKEVYAQYYIDSRPPSVRTRISGSVQSGDFSVALIADEPSDIYYEIGQSTPTSASPRYREPVVMRQNQTLRYIAVDRAGNRSKVGIMDELKNPMVSVTPSGGVYNHPVGISFASNVASTIYWRLLPDTTFRIVRDSVVLDQEGIYTLEYYSETEQGLSSPYRRQEYMIDLSAPRVKVRIRKGLKDSLTVFFKSSENATIYFTLDGASPLMSPNTQITGNKFLNSESRISVVRTKDTRISFIAEDVAGNISSPTLIDLSRPRAVPSVPAGADRVYDRILSITLNTYDQSRIYYARHGHTPTLDSSVFSEPITLVKSDTITAFTVDASGFRGDLDTFVYTIDLPPSPLFDIHTEELFVDEPIRFDASSTLDKESPFSRLLFRWDFGGDSSTDTTFRHHPQVSHTYSRAGIYDVRLDVKDTLGNVASTEKRILVKNICPPDMNFAVTPSGKTFCIDRYEYPNIEKKTPETSLSWVEAKMMCLDMGKRLCTAEEWRSACEGMTDIGQEPSRETEKKECAKTYDKIYASGSRKECPDGFGVNDMVGNVWEWVDTRREGYPLIMGGAYTYGDRARCTLEAESTVGTRDIYTGFRCCK